MDAVIKIKEENIIEEDDNECKARKLSVVAVLPRYGEKLGGGAEALVKSLLENMLRDSSSSEKVFNSDTNNSNGSVSSVEISRIEVWATCAVDHRTWQNYYPAGVTVENGVTVRRFPVDERNLEVFVAGEFAIADRRPLTVDEQLDWLENSVNSRALYKHIEEYGKEFDVILFAPYLFATSFWGALVHPERSVLIPCLHDEAYAYLGVFKYLFSRVAGLIFNAEPEMDLAQRLYALEDMESKSHVVGMSFDDSVAAALAFSPYEEVAKRFPSVKTQYLLYAGRKEQGKNLDLLINYYSAFRLRNPHIALSLVLVGSGDITFLDKLPDGVIDLGFVSEEEKALLMEHALLLCQPSVNESFSIVIMEAWLRKAPVLVHANCDVTKYHVSQSSGGLYFSNEDEFCGAVRKICDNEDLRILLGSAGEMYVKSKYCWNAVKDRLDSAFLCFGRNGSYTE